MSTSRKEIRRYLGMGNAVHEDIEKMIDDCLPLVEQAAEIKYAYRVFDLEWQDGYPVIEGTLIRSNHLAINLRSCDRVVIMAATLGSGVDRLIQKYEHISMASASVMQACAAAMTEDAVEEAVQQVKEYAASQGYFMKPRYSPGYGDLPLENQKLVFSLINLPKEIGVTLNDSLIMSPSKSVTAYIGLCKEPCKTENRKCSDCSEAERCPYRQEDSR